MATKPRHNIREINEEIRIRRKILKEIKASIDQLLEKKQLIQENATDLEVKEGG